jgi:hypothetical protein
MTSSPRDVLASRKSLFTASVTSGQEISLTFVMMIPCLV